MICPTRSRASGMLPKTRRPFAPPSPGNGKTNLGRFTECNHISCLLAGLLGQPTLRRVLAT